MFGEDGEITAGPFLYKNTLGEVFRHHKLIFRGPNRGISRRRARSRPCRWSNR